MDLTADDLRHPEHPRTCPCAGRGWFEDHGHNAACTAAEDHECVGCVKRVEPCRYRELQAADRIDALTVELNETRLHLAAALRRASHPLA